MPRLALLNILFGFLVLFTGACVGIFVALDSETALLNDKSWLDSWYFVLLRTAHGHSGLFGLIHIAMGLTLPYSKLNNKLKWIQCGGMLAGTLAMTLLLAIKAQLGPGQSLDILIGLCLSASLLALFSHCFGLGQKLFGRVI